MKTIQQYLKECDREAVANDYIYKYLFDHDLMDTQYDHLTIRDLKERTKKGIYSLIDRLTGLEPEFGDDRDILLIVHFSGLNSWDDDISAELVRESEVMSGAEEVQTYDYSLTTHSKMVSFYVADTYLTQHYLNELIVSFLHEALIMGPEQEHLEEELEKLERAAGESCSHEYLSMDDFMEEMEERFGFKREIHDKRQEEAERKLIRQRIEYDILCRKIEIKKLRDAIEKEDRT